MKSRRRIAWSVAAVVAVAGIVSLVQLTFSTGPFAPEPWRHVDGREIAFTAMEGRGPEHCASDRVWYFSFGEATYFRPSGHASLPGPVEGSFATLDALPAEARDTGWSRGDRSLWVVDAELDRRGVHRHIYMVWPDRIERWPRFLGGCM